MRFKKNTSTHFVSQLNDTYNYILQNRPKYSVIFYLVTGNEITVNEPI